MQKDHLLAVNNKYHITLEHQLGGEIEEGRMKVGRKKKIPLVHKRALTQ